jgi:ssDNA-binding protein
MKVQLKDVRITFPTLFEAKQVNGQGDPKFSASFLFPRTHAQVGELQKALIAAATEKWGAKTDEVLKGLKAGDRLAIHDGDAKTDYDGYAGNLFLNASNKIRPLVIDGNRAPLQAVDGKPYSGCYVNAIVELWAQDNQFGKRINASLLGVQFLRDGERLAGGGVAAADDFEELPAAAQEKAAATGAGAASLF